MRLVPLAVAEADDRAGLETAVTRVHVDSEQMGRHTREFIYDYRLSLIFG